MTKTSTTRRSVVAAGPVMLAGRQLPARPEIAVTRVGHKGEQTRNRPLLNAGMKDRGSGLAKEKLALSGGDKVLRPGKGNGSKEDTVWGQVHIVAKRLGAASPEGTFTLQALYNALFAHEWAATKATPKYTPADAEAYAGWIETLARGATGKRFSCAEAVAKAA